MGLQPAARQSVLCGPHPHLQIMYDVNMTQ
jgi:hypothetical protein